MTTFGFTSGNPDNLVGGSSASMTDIGGSLTDLKNFLNSRNLNQDNLPVSMLQQLGLNDSSGQKGRGKSIIAQTETRTNAAYGTMPTPDQVAGIVLPVDGLIFIAAEMTWQQSAASAAWAAIFLNSVQLRLASNLASPAVAETTIGGNINNDTPLTTYTGGVISNTAPVAYTGDVTTGQVVGGSSGGICTVFAAAGTYTVSVQFRSTSGNVIAKNRKLWVWTLGF